MVVRCGGGVSESREVPWIVGTLDGAVEPVDVVLEVYVGRGHLSGCRCQDMWIRGEVLDGGGVHDAEALREFVTLVEWIGAAVRQELGNVFLKKFFV